MCGHTRDPIIYSEFHRNPFMGFGAPGGQNLAFPITLASRFYNSLYYRTSRDSTADVNQHPQLRNGGFFGIKFYFQHAPDDDNSHMRLKKMFELSSVVLPAWTISILLHGIRELESYL